MSYMHFLFALGTLAGLIYWGFGLAAASYFKDKKMSASDRLISTMMLWSLSFSSYEAEGQKLCSRGNIALVIAVISWALWLVLQNK
jgi:hypothetical protein